MYIVPFNPVQQVLLWEIATLGATPYGLLPSGVVMHCIKEGERLQKPTHCSRDFFAVVDGCWRDSPEERPTFAALVESLRRFLATDDAIDMNNYQEDLYQKLSPSNDVTDERV